MGINREVYVYTTVTCDECGKEILSWNGDEISGMSKGWAKYYARKKGATVGKAVTCKECRIKEKIRACRLRKRLGEPGREADGTCRGFGTERDDEPIENCKNCIACTEFDWEETVDKIKL